MSEQSIALTNGPVAFEGAVSLEPRDGGIQPWRIPWRDRDLFEQGLIEKAAAAAGVRLSFVSDTSSLTLEATLGECIDGRVMKFDLLVDGQLHERQSWPVEGGEGAITFADLPAGEHHLELYLSQMGPIVVRGLSIDDGATAKAWDDPRPRWVVYGSSITHCGAAAGPSETWPALVANRFDLNLTCLGYGGNCHLEPVVARMIRDLPADYISLCLGINTHGGSLNDRTFRAAVLGLILTIREKHPTTPIACVSPIYSPPRETTPSINGNTLVQMRQRVEEAVEVLTARGDENLHYISGLDVFGEDCLHYMPDELHPDAEGYRALADHYGQAVMSALGIEQAVAV